MRRYDWPLFVFVMVYAFVMLVLTTYQACDSIPEGRPVRQDEAPPLTIQGLWYNTPNDTA